MKNYEVIKEPRGRGQLGMIYYAVKRDSDFPDEIAVYELRGSTLFRLKGKGQRMWPKALSSFDGKTDGNLKLELHEIKSDLRSELGLDFARISISEVYVGSGFMDMAR